MQVLFTHGYFLADDPKERAIMKPYPPLGLLYLSAWLDRYGVENEIFDTTFSSVSDLHGFLLEQQPPIIAVYTNLMTKLQVIRLMDFVRSTPSLSGSLLVLGGPDVTHNTGEYLAAGADLIVIGEGEQTMLELTLRAQALHVTGGSPQTGEVFSDIPGLAFRWPDGAVFKTDAREKIRDIDTLPFPNRQKIDLGRYLDAWEEAHGHRAISLSTQRGCPYTCRWCSTAVYGQSYRRRSPQHVVAEIKQLQEQYDFDLIWFVDDVFTVSHKWLREFREELDRQHIRIRFECITRADRLNEEALELLRQSGCFRVWIGAESGSQRIIDAMDRRVDVQQVRRMIQAARLKGIETGTFIMLGYPGETERDIMETVAHLKASNPDLFTITVAYPIKGTGLYEAVETELTAPLPWAERTDRDLDFPRSYPRRYYDFAVRYTVNAVLLDKTRRIQQGRSLTILKLMTKAIVARVGMWVMRLAIRSM